MLWRKTPVIALSIIGTGFAGANLFKERTNGSIFNKDIMADKKVIIVTGANSGIGREAAEQFAKRGATVYMACRDLKKCEEERTAIVLSTSNRYVYCRPCDLASFESIRKFVDIFKTEQNQLDILVNNAGVMRCPKSVTSDGIEMQLGVNHMGHFLLTNLLIDHIKKSPAGRIVVVSSRAHKNGKINIEDLNSENAYDPGDAYNQSKLANILFTNELSSRLLGTNITVNAIHPGIVHTNIARHLKVAKGIYSYITYPISWPFVKDSYHGCQTILHAALDPSLQNVSGKYFSDMEEDEISEDGKNIEIARWLWAVSEKWTKIIP